MYKQKARYPVRHWLGKFESWLLVMRGSSAMYSYDRTLERLFAMFPKKLSCDDFISTDISDYKLVRLQQGRDPYAVSRELHMIYKFWQWLIVDQSLHMWNPAKAFQNIEKGVRKRKNHDLSLMDVSRLLKECTLEDQKLILSIVKGGRCPRGRGRTTILEAANRAGLVNFTMSHLKTTLRTRLSKEIVEAFCSQILKDIDLQEQPNLDSQTTPTNDCMSDKARL